MKQVFSIALIAMLLVLSGCATTQLPVNSGSNTVLVIPKSVVNTSSAPWARRFRLVISRYSDVLDQNSKIKVVKEVDISRDSNNYLLIDDLPPGQYAIENITNNLNSGYRSSGGKKQRQRELFYPFVLTPGEVTLVDTLAYVRQSAGKSGSSYYVSYKLKALPEALKKSILAELKSGSEFSSWKVDDQPVFKERDFSDIQSKINQHKPAIYSEFNKTLDKYPHTSGIFKYRMAIAPNGEVTDFKVVSSSFATYDFEDKIIKELKSINFGVNDVYPTNFKHSFTFYIGSEDYREYSTPQALEKHL